MTVPRLVRRLVVSCILKANTPAYTPTTCTISIPPDVVNVSSISPFKGEVWAVAAIQVLSAPTPDVITVLRKNLNEIWRSPAFSLIAGKIDKTEKVTTTEAVYDINDVLSLSVIPLAAVGAEDVTVTFYVEVGVFK